MKALIKKKRKYTRRAKPEILDIPVLENIVHAAEDVIKAERGKIDETPIRAKILERGIDITLGDRNESYGDPLRNFDAIARLKHAFWHTINTREEGPLLIQNSPAGHAMDMVFTNLGRIASAPSEKALLDSDRTVDGATYLAIFGELVQRTY